MQTHKQAEEVIAAYHYHMLRKGYLPSRMELINMAGMAIRHKKIKGWRKWSASQGLIKKAARNAIRLGQVKVSDK